MMRPEEGIDRLAALVERRLGLVPASSTKEELLAFLEEKAPRRQWEAYLDRLESAGTGDAELRTLAERLTVGETYFFRHLVQLEALVEQVLPTLQQRGRSARVLCAGCSTGEEAYSLSILARESARVDPSRLFITGVDLNARSIERARRAHYGPWALRVTPQPFRERWFQALPDGTFVLSPEVRDSVFFEERNLLDEAPDFWAAGAFDVILFRNVLIYFSPEAARRSLSRFEQALTPGGFLFLGPSETLRGLSESFETVQAGDAFYFQRERVRPDIPRTPPRPSPPLRAAEVTPTTPTGARNRLKGPERAWRLLEEERYAEARAWLEALPQHEREQSLSKLLSAALHLQSGAFREAERLGEALAESGVQAAEAHYLLGLCREQAGDGHHARARYERAVHLEPTFALGHLRLGMLARREGAATAARVALRLALILLAHEQPLHLTLFGGGFGRHGLMQVCQRELWACLEAA
ncbi:CheR family methyltransferase [Hyalangium versicolor]|uniref:CheR family methyltransferase n=1 Tax=Hyalangium versicolor TaxID=2861190 RepID=UPI001CD03EB9|nr:protein-glutamate O-methyltransferase CheR [Hyalangium versicolor]